MAVDPAQTVAGAKVTVGTVGFEQGATQVTEGEYEPNVMLNGVISSVDQFVRSLIKALKAVEVPVKVPVYLALSSSVPIEGKRETQFTPFVKPVGKEERETPAGVQHKSFQPVTASSVNGDPFPSSP